MDGDIGSKEAGDIVSLLLLRVGKDDYALSSLLVCVKGLVLPSIYFFGCRFSHLAVRLRPNWRRTNYLWVLKIFFVIG